MKKIYQIIVLSIVGIALVSCDSESSTRSEMEQACEDHEFIKAYELASKLDKDATNHVVEMETAYIIESQAEAGLGRITIILNEHKDIASNIYLNLLKMAIIMENESLATKLYKMSEVFDEQVIDYAIASDMENLIVVFLNNNPKYIDEQNVVEYLKEKGIYEGERQKKFEIAMNQIKNKPTIYNQGLTQEDLSIDARRQNEIIYMHNNECLRLLGLAIEYKNLSAAKQCINAMLPNVEYYQGDSGNPVIHGYKLNYTTNLIWHNGSVIQDAQNKLKQAIKEGAFK